MQIIIDIIIIYYYGKLAIVITIGYILIDGWIGFVWMAKCIFVVISCEWLLKFKLQCRMKT